MAMARPIVFLDLGARCGGAVPQYCPLVALEGSMKAPVAATSCPTHGPDGGWSKRPIAKVSGSKCPT